MLVYRSVTQKKLGGSRNEAFCVLTKNDCFRYLFCFHCTKEIQPNSSSWNLMAIILQIRLLQLDDSNFWWHSMPWLACFARYGSLDASTACRARHKIKRPKTIPSTICMACIVPSVSDQSTIILDFIVRRQAGLNHFKTIHKPSRRLSQELHCCFFVSFCARARFNCWCFRGCPWQTWTRDRLHMRAWPQLLDIRERFLLHQAPRLHATVRWLRHQFPPMPTL